METKIGTVKTMKCTKCGQILRCTKCGAAALADCNANPASRALAGSIQEELRNRSVCVEVSKGVMRKVLLLSDVEEILAKMAYSSITRSSPTVLDR